MNAYGDYSAFDVVLFLSYHLKHIAFVFIKVIMGYSNAAGSIEIYTRV